MIVPGVLNGSQGALYYPVDEVIKNPGIWNGVPVTINHPFDDLGNNVSARDPKIEKKFRIGTVYNDRFSNGKRRAEVWLDEELTKNKAPEVYKLASQGQPIELSTGLFTDNEPVKNGKSPDGREYQFIARNYRPDHLAILPNQTGACSLKDGCGLNVNCLCGGTCDKCKSKRSTNTTNTEVTSVTNQKRTLLTKIASLLGFKVQTVTNAKKVKSEDDHEEPDADDTGGPSDDDEDNVTDNAWTDEARQAAAEARKARTASKTANDLSKHPTTTKESATADSASKHAEVAGHVGGHIDASLSHAQAAAAHMHANRTFRKAGETDKADAHLKAFAAHSKASKAHEAITRKAFDSPSMAKNAKTNDEPAFDDRVDEDNVTDNGGPGQVDNCGGEGGTPGPCASGVDKKHGKSRSEIASALSTETRQKYGQKNLDTRGHTQAAEAHENAVGIHQEAAREQSKLGNYQKATTHTIAAKNHAFSAKKHRAWEKSGKTGSIASGKPIGNNSSNGDDMDRNKLVSWLTTNCDCHKGKEKVLANQDNYTDEELRKLKLNAEKAMKNAQFVANASNDDPDAEPDEDDNDATDEQKGNNTGNKGIKDPKDPMKAMAKNMSLADFEKTMPAGAKAIWNAAKEVEHAERSRLVSIITANMQDETRKEVLTNRLMNRDKTTLDEVRDLASAIPQRPTRNQFAPHAQPVANYFGSQPYQPVQVNNSGIDDILELPTINWADLAKSGDVRTRV